MPEKVVIGNAELWHGDCREVLPLVPACAAVVTDPPYGQAYKVNTRYAGGNTRTPVAQRGGGVLFVERQTYQDIMGDDEPFDPAPLLGLAPTVVLWGAHKFHDRLPEGSWLVWDKVPTGKRRDQGDGEAAWINRQQPLRIFRLLWDGLCVGEGARHEVTAGQQRYHPAQKPEVLMRWCIEQAGTPASVLDPYMGSGSTGVAASQMGLQFIGVEAERRYFDIACRRIEQAQAQGQLLPPEPTAVAVQQSLELP